MSSTSTLSLRLPKDARDRLDKAAAQSRRSRSYIVQEALDRHLDEIVREESQQKPQGLSFIRSLAGIGAERYGARTKEEIDSHIRWLRDNE